MSEILSVDEQIYLNNLKMEQCINRIIVFDPDPYWLKMKDYLADYKLKYNELKQLKEEFKLDESN